MAGASSSVSYMETEQQRERLHEQHGRGCKACIDNKFGSENIIKCPMPHDDIDEEDLPEEPCQQNGLHKDQVLPDSASNRVLLREKCFCPHQTFGCDDTPTWRKLKDHVLMCGFTPVHCVNAGCPEKFAKEALDRHLEHCQFQVVACRFCGERYKRNQLEDHYGECERADSQCNICGTKFERRKQLMVHQRIHVPCITAAGKCHFYDYCKFEAATVPILKQHMEKDKDKHLESLAVKIHDIEQATAKTKDMSTSNIKRTINAKVKPLENMINENAMIMKKLSDHQEASETNGDHLMNDMRTVTQNSQQIKQVSGNRNIEKQMRDSELDREIVIESHSQNIRRHNELKNDSEKRMKTLSIIMRTVMAMAKVLAKVFKTLSIIMRTVMAMAKVLAKVFKGISNIKKTINAKVKPFKNIIDEKAMTGKKLGDKQEVSETNGDHPMDAVRTVAHSSQQIEQVSGKVGVIERQIGDSGLDQGTVIESHSQNIRRHNELTNNSEKRIKPDPDSSSFRKPQTEMNIASGCPQFALHSEVESSNFLISDSIYIRVKVEPGGDIIV
ncbi:TNF receptor-associated factor 3-like [Watersipora subatra]|uniref:TNF receptor-associated factor 3-like n=1 Tax=Watersipora subatra TaxID=2589382 RepID=UPI00355BF647